jgi:hypothetical protein
VMLRILAIAMFPFQLLEVHLFLLRARLEQMEQLVITDGDAHE